jgi:hypothetical protein
MIDEMLFDVHKCVGVCVGVYICGHTCIFVCVHVPWKAKR